jgi:hypothetical protein
MTAIDWLPHRREAQVALSKNWQTILTTKAMAWNVPTADVTALKTLTPTADSAPDPHRSDYGFRVYFGILPPGSANAWIFHKRKAARRFIFVFAMRTPRENQGLGGRFFRRSFLDGVLGNSSSSLLTRLEVICTGFLHFGLHPSSVS